MSLYSRIRLQFAVLFIAVVVIKMKEGKGGIETRDRKRVQFVLVFAQSRDDPTAT